MSAAALPIRHFCTYPGNGGAGIAALRLVRAQREAGTDAILHGLVASEDEILRGIAYERGLLANLHRRWRARQIRRLAPGYSGISQQGGAFFTDRCTHGVAMAEAAQGAALIHLHWVCDLMDYGDTLLRLPPRTPVVWTLHDMGSFTGGCSYSLGCDGFTRSCSACPQLTTAAACKEAAASHARRLAAVQRHLADRLTLITPSNWLAGEARRSSIFRDVRCEVIPNAFPLEIFHPDLREQQRAALGWPPGDQVLLFAAASVDNPVKGMDLLLKSLPALQRSFPNLRVTYVGNRSGDDLPEGWHWLGAHSDERELARIYAATDVLVVPSRADNYPNVIGESLACGVPVVAADTGGIPDLVRPGETGQLFAAGSAEAFARVLSEFLSNLPDTRTGWMQRCRLFAERHLSGATIAARHHDLYNQLGIDKVPSLT